MLLLSERDVAELLPTSDAVAILEQELLSLRSGSAQNAARVRVQHENFMLHVLPAAGPGPNLGAKLYLTGAPQTRFVYLLFGSSGIEAMIAADHLGRIRTGAAAGLATRYLSRPDAGRLVVIGAGNQAFTNIEAMIAVRPIRHVTIVNRSLDKAQALAVRVAERFHIEAKAHDDAALALAQADILSTVTSSREPVFSGTDLPEQIHINAVGSNRATHAELDEIALSRAETIVVEDLEQAKVEAGDLLRYVHFDWQRVQVMTSIVDTDRPHRPGISIFESLGIGLWDLALARELFTRARLRDRGTRVELDTFFAPPA